MPPHVLEAESIAAPLVAEPRMAFSALGMRESAVAALIPAVRRPGLVLIAGPRGSGRSSTLQALLGLADDAAIFDSLTDRQHATRAVEAAEEQLVFATIEAPNAVRAIGLMRDWRVERFLLASTLRAATAQRRVRRLCPACRRPEQASASASALLGFDSGAIVYAPVGCGRCQSGFAGETAVFECIAVDSGLRRLINSGGDDSILARHAHLHAPNLGSAARALVREGVTTAEEAIRLSRS